MRSTQAVKSSMTDILEEAFTQAVISGQVVDGQSFSTAKLPSILGVDTRQMPPDKVAHQTRRFLKMLHARGVIDIKRGPNSITVLCKANLFVRNPPTYSAKIAFIFPRPSTNSSSEADIGKAMLGALDEVQPYSGISVQFLYPEEVGQHPNPMRDFSGVILLNESVDIHYLRSRLNEDARSRVVLIGDRQIRKPEGIYSRMLPLVTMHNYLCAGDIVDYGFQNKCFNFYTIYNEDSASESDRIRGLNDRLQYYAALAPIVNKEFVNQRLALHTAPTYRFQETDESRGVSLVSYFLHTILFNTSKRYSHSIPQIDPSQVKKIREAKVCLVSQSAAMLQGIIHALTEAKLAPQKDLLIATFGESQLACKWHIPYVKMDFRAQARYATYKLLDSILGRYLLSTNGASEEKGGSLYGVWDSTYRQEIDPVQGEKINLHAL